MSKNLPLELLNELSVRQVGLINGYFGHFYHHRRSLRKPESNIRLLLTWSFMPHSQTLEALRHWVGSEEGLHLYHRLIDSPQSQQTLEEFALTLAALLSRERLLICSENDTVNPVDCGYLACFDALLNGEHMSNKRTIFERVIMSLVRVLQSLEEDNDDLIQLLANILGRGAPILDGLVDHYCAQRVIGLDHRKALDEARMRLVKSMEAMQHAEV